MKCRLLFETVRLSGLIDPQGRSHLMMTKEMNIGEISSFVLLLWFIHCSDLDFKIISVLNKSTQNLMK